MELFSYSKLDIDMRYKLKVTRISSEGAISQVLPKVRQVRKLIKLNIT